MNTLQERIQLTFKEYRPQVFLTVFLLAVVGTLASLIIYPFHDTGRAENLFAKSSFYFFNGLFVTWIYCLHQWRNTVFSNISGYTKACALFFCLLLTLIVWFGVEHSFKVLSDEANLMAISQSFTFEKTAYNHTMGRWYYDNFWPISNQLDKRPILFPYLLQFLHVIFGYSIANVYILNSLFLFLFLYVVFTLVFPIGGFLGGIAGMFFVLAQPILSITAISGGFDLFACLLQISVAYMVLQLCKKENPTLRPLIWYTLVLLVHARYENLIAFPIVIGTLWFFKKFSFSDLKKNPYLYSLSLIFLIPRIWQFMVPQNYENPPGVPVLGWSNFVKHFPTFASDFFNMNFDLPYATILNVGGVAIALTWALVFLKKRTSLLPKNYFPFAIIIFTFACSELCITLSHHFGVFNHPTQARLFLVFMVTLSLSPFLLHGILGYFPKKAALLVAASLFLVYFPIAQENRFVNKLTIIRKTRWAYSFFDNLKDKNILIIVDRPGVYTIRPTGAVDFNWANSNIQTIRDDLKRRLYNDVYVLEDVPYGRERSQLSDKFELQTVFERQNTPQMQVRISKVISTEPKL